MNDKKEIPVEVKEQAPQPVKKPDEQSGLHIEAKLKIFDPESGKIIVEGRA